VDTLIVVERHNLPGISPEPGAGSWSRIASWYDELLAHGSGPHETAVACLRRLLPDLVGADILDVACGQGLATRALAASGARTVVGVDSSLSMIELARERTDPSLPISFSADDAEQLSSCGDSSFDGITCQLGLMDIPDLPAAIRSIQRVLKVGGWFIFVIGHPCFLAPGAVTVSGPSSAPGRLVQRYFDEGFWRSANPDGIRGRVGNYHRTLSTYLNTLAGFGFHLDAFEEPLPSPLLSEREPVYSNLPIFFAARSLLLRRAPGGP
jgi:ubiquinone/menaquinone biosynthesis C-methylase UbiE